MATYAFKAISNPTYGFISAVKACLYVRPSLPGFLIRWWSIRGQTYLQVYYHLTDDNMSRCHDEELVCMELYHHLVGPEPQHLLVNLQYYGRGAVVGGLRRASPVVNSVLTRVWPLRCLWPLTPESLVLPPGGGLFLIWQHLHQTGAQLSSLSL